MKLGDVIYVNKEWEHFIEKVLFVSIFLIITLITNTTSAQLQPIENNSLFLHYINETTGLSIEVSNPEHFTPPVRV